MKRRFVLTALFLLITSGGYLLAFAQATIFYEATVLAHLAAGIGLCAAAVGLLRRYPRECGAFLASAAPSRSFRWLAAMDFRRASSR